MEGKAMQARFWDTYEGWKSFEIESMEQTVYNVVKWSQDDGVLEDLYTANVNEALRIVADLRENGCALIGVRFEEREYEVRHEDGDWGSEHLALTVYETLEECEQGDDWALDLLSDWQGQRDAHDWFALDSYDAEKGAAFRLQVGARAEIAERAKTLVNGDNLVDYAGNMCEPGEFGEVPFYRITLISTEAAREHIELFAAGKENRLSINPSWLSVSEAAARLGVNRQRVNQLIAVGKLDAEMVGGSWIVSERSVEARKAENPKAGRPRG